MLLVWVFEIDPNFRARTENDLVDGRGSKWIRFSCGWSYLDFLCSAGNDVVLVRGSIFLVFVWRIEMDVVFMWMVEIGLIFVFGQK